MNLDDGGATEAEAKKFWGLCRRRVPLKNK